MILNCIFKTFGVRHLYEALRVLIGATELAAEKNLVTDTCFTYTGMIWVVRKFYWS